MSFVFQGKLVKLYSRLLLSKSSFIESGALRAKDVVNIPPLDQWLKVVGLTHDAIPVSKKALFVCFFCLFLFLYNC